MSIRELMIGDHAMPLLKTNSIKIKQIDTNSGLHSSGHGTYDSHQIAWHRFDFGFC